MQIFDWYILKSLGRDCSWPFHFLDGQSFPGNVNLIKLALAHMAGVYVG